MYMTAIRKKYKDSDLKTILNYLNKLMDARNKLNGMSDEVFMVHVAEGLLGSELNDYIKHAMNTDGINLARHGHARHLGSDKYRVRPEAPRPVVQDQHQVISVWR